MKTISCHCWISKLCIVDNNFSTLSKNIIHFEKKIRYRIPFKKYPQKKHASKNLVRSRNFKREITKLYKSINLCSNVWYKHWTSTKKNTRNLKTINVGIFSNRQTCTFTENQRQLRVNGKSAVFTNFLTACSQN